MAELTNVDRAALTRRFQAAARNVARTVDFARGRVWYNCSTGRAAVLMRGCWAPKGEIMRTWPIVTVVFAAAGCASTGVAPMDRARTWCQSEVLKLALVHSSQSRCLQANDFAVGGENRRDY